MRVLVLATSVLAILAGADTAMAGPSTARRDVSASVEPAPVNTTQATHATRYTERQTGPDRAARHGIRHQAHYRGGARHHRIGGPIGLVGGVVAGLFGRH
jgi:hypothetical protein